MGLTLGAGIVPRHKAQGPQSCAVGALADLRGAAQMTTVCMICHCVKSGSGDPISHGLCYPCRELIYGVPSVPALMAPAPTRLECFRCDQSTLDSDGVAEGCRINDCIMPGRRSPWFLVELHHKLFAAVKADTAKVVEG